MGLPDKLPGDEVILEANLVLQPGDKAQIGEEMDRRFSRRRTRQPLGVPLLRLGVPQPAT